jgi:hypothetical protein
MFAPTRIENTFSTHIGVDFQPARHPALCLLQASLPAHHGLWPSRGNNLQAKAPFSIVRYHM